MTSTEAEKILQDFGKVHELASQIGFAIPEQFLPHPKKKILEAVDIAFLVGDAEYKQLLGALLVYLPSYVPIDEAIIVFRFLNAVSNIKNGNANQEDLELKEEASKIMDRINAESKELLDKYK